MTDGVIVVGGGMVGATLACLLDRGGVAVTLVDARPPPAWDPGEPVGLRVSALSPGSEAILEQAGAWATVRGERHCPYRRMHVEDGQGAGTVDFEAAVFGLDHLGTLVENDLVIHALWRELRASPRVRLLAPARLAEVERRAQGARCVLEDGTVLEGALLVGCDGPGSAVRRAVGLGGEAWEYNQQAVVGVVHAARPNPGVAWQRFLPGGPLALLPLADGDSSIVWSLPAREAETVLAEDEESFLARLDEATGGWPGAAESVGPRAAFPLAMSLGDHYVAGRVVLLGDAAHVVHPLAGQGVNLGLADAAALVETLFRQRANGQALGAAAGLASFERWRRSETVIMARGVHGLGALFRPGTLAPLRGLGMRWVGRSWLAREAFLRRAAGIGPNAPRLARGATLGELLSC